MVIVASPLPDMGLTVIQSGTPVISQFMLFDFTLNVELWASDELNETVLDDTDRLTGLRLMTALV